MDCSRESNFRIVFSNRTEDIIEAKMDGNVLGNVSAGEDRQFVVEARILDSSPTGADYPDVAEVNFSARNLTSLKISRQVRRTIYTDRVEYITIEKNDF